MWVMESGGGGFWVGGGADCWWEMMGVVDYGAIEIGEEDFGDGGCCRGVESGRGVGGFCGCHLEWRDFFCECGVVGFFF